MDTLKYILIKDIQTGGTTRRHSIIGNPDYTILPITPYGKIYWSFEKFLTNNSEFMVKYKTKTTTNPLPAYTFGIDIGTDFKFNFSKLFNKPVEDKPVNTSADKPVNTSADKPVNTSTETSTETQVDTPVMKTQVGTQSTETPVLDSNVKIEKKLFTLDNKSASHIQTYKDHVYFKGTFTFIIYNVDYNRLTPADAEPFEKLKQKIITYITTKFDNIDSQYLYFYFQYKHKHKGDQIITGKIIIKIDYIPPISLMHANTSIIDYSLDFDFAVSCLKQNINLFTDTDTTPANPSDSTSIIINDDIELTLPPPPNTNVYPIPLYIHPNHPNHPNHNPIITLLDEAIQHTNKMTTEMTNEMTTEMTTQYSDSFSDSFSDADLFQKNISTGIGLSLNDNFLSNFYNISTPQPSPNNPQMTERSEILDKTLNIQSIMDMYKNDTSNIYYKKLVTLINWFHLIHTQITQITQITQTTSPPAILQDLKEFITFIYHKSIPSVIKTIFLIENKFIICKYINYIGDNVLLVGWFQDKPTTPIYVLVGTYDLFNTNKPEYIKSQLIIQNSYIDQFGNNTTEYEFGTSTHPLLISSVAVNNIYAEVDLTEVYKATYKSLYTQTFVVPLLKKDLIPDPTNTTNQSNQQLTTLPSIQDIIYDRKNCQGCKLYGKYYDPFMNASEKYFEFLYTYRLYKTHVHIFINNLANCSYILVPDNIFWDSVQLILTKNEHVTNKQFAKILNDNSELMIQGRFQLWLIHDTFKDRFFHHTDDNKWYHTTYQQLINSQPPNPLSDTQEPLSDTSSDISESSSDISDSSSDALSPQPLQKQPNNYNNVFEFKTPELIELNKAIETIKKYFKNYFFNEKELLFSWHIYNGTSNTIPHLRIQPVQDLSDSKQGNFIINYNHIYRHLTAMNIYGGTIMHNILDKFISKNKTNNLDNIVINKMHMLTYK